jgi:5-methylcytosine-specific restriction endonuclease McrA
MPRSWTKDENQKLLRLRQEGWRWVEIKKEFPGRTADSCRSRHGYLKCVNELFQEYETMSKIFEKYNDGKSELKLANLETLENLENIHQHLSELEKNLRELLCRRLEIKHGSDLSVYKLEQMIKGKQE